jgi:hypothetical protein
MADLKKSLQICEEGECYEEPPTLVVGKKLNGKSQIM